MSYTKFTPRGIWAYLFAIALVSLALLLSLELETAFSNPFWLFFPVALVATTWFCGGAPGWVATVVSSLAVLYYFVPPLRNWSLHWHDAPFLVTFIATEVFANWAIAKRKRIEASLKEANDALVRRIEEQRLTQEALQITRAELARVVRITTIGELAATIAHEVNQPLAAIVANTYACVAWLSRATPNLVEARVTAERASQGATRASEIIGRIRSMIDNAPAEKTHVHLNQLIKETIDLTADQAARHSVSVSLDLSSDLPLLYADKIQMQQVIMNLMTNGIEATSSVTGRDRQLVLLTQTLQDGYVRVSVRDNGVGVREETLGRLFEPFFTTRSQGIGMGLAISRSIIEAHGGRLWADSIYQQGSNFQFTIPIHSN